ncbi:beta/alpha barrel domain-containing protein [Nonomuraea jabiensis]|uniref:hypothetical protein n=1 Tax=Nonomuraea jabiensis TaxID=882448 RepID=UPI0036C093CE
MVKLFPASHTSPQVLRDVLQALPHASLAPTGGVTIRRAPDWIAAGAVAVGGGGELTRAAPADVQLRMATGTSSVWRPKLPAQPGGSVAGHGCPRTRG